MPLLPPEPLAAVVHAFYDRVYAHPWIGQYFAHVDQAHQELKLVRFLQMSWDDQSFSEMQAQYLQQEHAHMYIPAALFDLRDRLFSEAVRACGHGEREVEAFLQFNGRWRPHVVKDSIEDCSSVLTAVVAHPDPAAPSGPEA